MLSVRIPRRAAIYTLLTLASFTYLLDGLVFVLYTVWEKAWPRLTGIEPNAITGIVAFSGLAALGAWKEVNGVEVWTRKRVKSTVGLTLLLDIALTVLAAITLKISHDKSKCMHSSTSIISQIAETLSSHSATPHIPEITWGLDPKLLAQVAFPAFRVLILAPLWIVLLKPRLVWTPVESASGAAEDEEATPTDTSLLLPASAANQPSTGLQVSQDASKYGTFSSTSSSSGAANTVGAVTPARSASGAPVKVKTII